MRLGCAVKILGKTGLKSYDARQLRDGPHLSVSLAYLRDILRYLDRIGIRFYRLSSRLHPYHASPDSEEFRGQLMECDAEIAYVGDLVRQMGMRLSVHAPLHVVLNAEDATIVSRGIHELAALAQILDALGVGPEGVIVLHVGGVYDDKDAAALRFVRAYEGLPEWIRCRLVVENDEKRYSVGDLETLSHRCGCPIVFDRLHFLLNNPEGLSISEGFRIALGSWPPGMTPMIHFSSPRTDMHYLARGRSSGAEHIATAPSWSEHSDYVNPFEFINLMEAVNVPQDVDVMLEAKAKDLAVIRLKEDLARYSPVLARGLGARPKC